MTTASQQLLAAMWGLFARSVGDLCRAAESKAGGVLLERLRTIDGRHEVLIVCFAGKPALESPAKGLLNAPPVVIPDWPRANVGRLVAKTIRGSGFGRYTSSTGQNNPTLIIAAEPRSISLLEQALEN